MIAVPREVQKHSLPREPCIPRRPTAAAMLAIDVAPAFIRTQAAHRQRPLPAHHVLTLPALTMPLAPAHPPTTRPVPAITAVSALPATEDTNPAPVPPPAPAKDIIPPTRAATTPARPYRFAEALVMTALVPPPAPTKVTNLPIRAAITTTRPPRSAETPVIIIYRADIPIRVVLTDAPHMPAAEVSVLPAVLQAISIVPATAAAIIRPAAQAAEDIIPAVRADIPIRAVPTDVRTVAAITAFAPPAALQAINIPAATAPRRNN